jgi:inorganic pyrophosphatase
MPTRLDRLPARADDGSVHVVVESPQGARVKLKFDPGLGAMTLSRPLPSGLVYPYDWGFVPGTRASDGDPLDALALSDCGTAPGVVIRCRLIGVLEVEQDSKSRDARERNDRLIAVPVSAARFEGLVDASALPGRTREEIEQFFVAVTAFERKHLRILGWSGPAAAASWLDRFVQAAQER